MYAKLREERLRQNFTAQEMSKLLGLKTTSAYYKKENGKIKISIDEALKISNKLSKKVEDIFM
ncbi:helix-turn-helix transcriptional regulator [Vallitalea guaymasensis]|uniref:Helix-turn-helix transcriptional regulator n=1 Tax=Vallitalea guaymasensis TaxID=1185412 RepID=A0A8J8M8W9_9FIRM|nr:helix-turn-helix domain-containing protein [Vallitalea guaymasensis]QUH28295.1 helix-turn-helix transcriptional regulator [Vallitalea guaymasensis]